MQVQSVHRSQFLFPCVAQPAFQPNRRHARASRRERAYAKPSTAGAGGCLSCANACTLQTALATAGLGNEIWQ